MSRQLINSFCYVFYLTFYIKNYVTVVLWSSSEAVSTLQLVSVPSTDCMAALLSCVVPDELPVDGVARVEVGGLAAGMVLVDGVASVDSVVLVDGVVPDDGVVLVDGVSLRLVLLPAFTSIGELLLDATCLRRFLPFDFLLAPPPLPLATVCELLDWPRILARASA